MITVTLVKNKTYNLSDVLSQVCDNTTNVVIIDANSNKFMIVDDLDRWFTSLGKVPTSVILRCGNKPIPMYEIFNFYLSYNDTTIEYLTGKGTQILDYREAEKEDFSGR